MLLWKTFCCLILRFSVIELNWTNHGLQLPKYSMPEELVQLVKNNDFWISGAMCAVAVVMIRPLIE